MYELTASEDNNTDYWRELLLMQPIATALYQYSCMLRWENDQVKGW